MGMVSFDMTDVDIAMEYSSFFSLTVSALSNRKNSDINDASW